MDLNQAQYAEKITLEEYNRQKEEYTQNALKELQQQMKQTTHQPKSKMFKFNDDDDDNKYNVNEYSDDDAEDVDSVEDIASSIDKNGNAREKQTNVNLIIKHVTAREKRKNISSSDKQSIRKTNNSNSLEAEFREKHEVDTKTIQSLKNLIVKINEDLDCESRKNHYLKLDLNNAQCDNDVLKKNISVLRKEHEKTQKEIIELKKESQTNEVYMMIMKITIAVLLLVNIIY
jgi:outer membrane lipopolysaccharide assembly protein LptE/RlpB